MIMEKMPSDIINFDRDHSLKFKFREYDLWKVGSWVKSDILPATAFLLLMNGYATGCTSLIHLHYYQFYYRFMRLLEILSTAFLFTCRWIAFMKVSGFTSHSVTHLWWFDDNYADTCTNFNQLWLCFRLYNFKQISLLV